MLQLTASACVPVAAFMICFIVGIFFISVPVSFFRDPRAEVTAERLREYLLAEGLTVSDTDDPLRVRWKEGGPELFVSIHRGTAAEVIARGVVGKRRKHRKLIPGCDAYVRITFHDLDEVLDEINTLNQVQWAVQAATRGLGYNSWNQAMWGPDD